LAAASVPARPAITPCSPTRPLSVGSNRRWRPGGSGQDQGRLRVLPGVCRRGDGPLRAAASLSAPLTSPTPHATSGCCPTTSGCSSRLGQPVPPVGPAGPQQPCRARSRRPGVAAVGLRAAVLGSPPAADRWVLDLSQDTDLLQPPRPTSRSPTPRSGFSSPLSTYPCSSRQAGDAAANDRTSTTSAGNLTRRRGFGLGCQVGQGYRFAGDPPGWPMDQLWRVDQLAWPPARESWLRPAALARYSAASARCSRASAVIASPGSKAAIPALNVSLPPGPAAG
jgi:hypothetical protein